MHVIKGGGGVIKIIILPFSVHIVPHTTYVCTMHTKNKSPAKEKLRSLATFISTLPHTK